jgi:hypothetical protein
MRRYYCVRVTGALPEKTAAVLDENLKPEQRISSVARESRLAATMRYLVK